MRLLILTFGISLGLALPAAATLQSASQHGELLKRGTITDRDGTVWDIRFIPGTRSINRKAVDGWRDAGDSIADLASSELWAEDVPTSFHDGIDFSRDVVVDHFATGISRDVRTAREHNRELRRGDFGRGFIVTWNWVKATGAALCRTVWLPIGVSAGAAFSVAAPVAHVLWRPIESGGHATLSGILWPTLSHAWNGTAWGATFFSGVPERQTRWVKRKKASTEYVLDSVRIEAFLRASIEEHLSAERKARTQLEFDRLQSQIAALYEEQKVYRKDLVLVSRELRDSPSVRERDRVTRDSQRASVVRLDSEAEAWLADEAGLDAAIAAALGDRDRAVSDSEVKAIRRAMERTIDAVLWHR